MWSRCAQGVRIPCSAPTSFSEKLPSSLYRRHMAGISGGSAELRKLSCAGACKGDTPKLELDELKDKLADLPAWEVSADNTKISRKFVAKNFVAAINFFNEVKELAEAEGHHPDLHLTNYRNVKVDLQTHSIGGVSLPDLVMAAKLDTLNVTYSPKWLQEHGSKQPQPSTNAT